MLISWLILCNNVQHIANHGPLAKVQNVSLSALSREGNDRGISRLKEKKQEKREWGVERRSHSRQYDERVTIDNRLSSTGLVSSGVACRLNWNKGENVGARGFSVPRLTPRLSFSLFLFLPR